MIAPYLLRPIIVLGLLALAAGPASTLVNLRRAEFGAETMVHGVFPGIVVGMAVGGRGAIIPGGAVCAALIAAALTAASRRPRSSEATTAVLLTAFFSLGIVISLRIGDMSGQLESLMFGRLLEVTDERLAQALIVCAVALLLIVATWKEQVAYAFDRTGARASGLRLLALDLVLNTAIAAAVVSASTAVGILLVIGYLVIPGATARILASRVRTMVLVAIAVGVGGGYLGMLLMALPETLDKPISPQATVALVMTGILLIAVGVSTARERLRGPARRAGSVQSAAVASTSTTVGAKASADPIGGPEDSARGVTPTAKRSRV